MSYLLFAIGFVIAGKCLWEVYLYFFDRSTFERMRAKIEDQEGEIRDIKHPMYMFIAYPFLIGFCFMIGYLFYIY